MNSNLRQTNILKIKSRHYLFTLPAGFRGVETISVRATHVSSAGILCHTSLASLLESFQAERSYQRGRRRFGRQNHVTGVEPRLSILARIVDDRKRRTDSGLNVPNELVSNLGRSPRCEVYLAVGLPAIHFEAYAFHGGDIRGSVINQMSK